MASSHTAFRPTRRRSVCGYTMVLTALLSAIWLPSANAEKTASDYFVKSLPGAPSPLLKMHAGHVEITPEHHGNMFFWLFQNRHIANRQRTVIWLNGGPGCSSMDGALMEVGPYRVNEDGTLRLSEGSWDEFSNILFVDNPVGTGFSYVDGDSYVTELDEMADQMVVFLEKFFKLFPEFSQDDLYLAGESYAGQHIPYIAKAILERNNKNPDNQWNMSGLLIGNGWISGPDQYLSYIPFAYENNLVQAGSDIASKLEAQQAVCVKDLNNGGKDHVDVSSCEAILQDMLSLSQDDGNCVNMYDVRKTDKYPSCGMNWPPDLEQVTPYLRDPAVVSALHINPDKKAGWRECNNQVSGAFRAANSKPSRELLPGLLEKMPILLFSGDKDLICNHVGTENLINDLEWNGGKGMEISPGTWAPRRDWTFEDEAAGIYQTARNLTYVTFFNASHMVPFDYPRRTRDMLDRFIGVDIGSIGGTPADSRIDGEKGPETSVGGHPNSTAAEEAEQSKLQEATWLAYRRSGEVALVIIILLAGTWGFFVWRDRKRRRGYRGVFGHDDDDEGGGGLRLDGFADRIRGKRSRDVEAADFDEAELDDLAGDDVDREGKGRKESREQFGLHDEDDDYDSEAEGGHGRRGDGHL